MLMPNHNPSYTHKSYIPLRDYLPIPTVNDAEYLIKLSIKR